MIQCAAVRRRGCNDQCTSRALKGHRMCGRHARAKNAVVWSHPREDKVIRIQAVLRGWIVRTRLKRAGPGVLSRKNLQNDEDFATYEDRVHPLEYFSFEEAGKVWWFRFDSLWSWVIRNEVPTNPYTKTPLSADARKRLRDEWGFRKRFMLPTPAGGDDRLRDNWNIICQALQDNGFTDVRPNMFTHLTKNELVVALRMMHDDLVVSIAASNRDVRTMMYLIGRNIQLASHLSSTKFAISTSYIFVLLLCLPKQPYIYAFTLLSALYRC